MPLDLQVISAPEFVRLDSQERLDFEESKLALRLLAQACRKRGVDRAVLDLRQLPVPDKPYFTSDQLAALVGTFPEAGFGRGQRLAVLYRSDPHGGARLFAFISRIQGWKVQAFDDFEAALNWLSEATSKPAETGAVAIPIHQKSIVPSKRLARQNSARRKTGRTVQRSR